MQFRRAIKIIPATLVVLVTFVYSANPIELSKQTQLVEDIYIKTNDDIRFERHKPVHDFEIVEFFYKDNYLMKIYIGNYPGFPSKNCSGQEFEKTEEGKTYWGLNCTVSKNNRHSEYLIDFSKKWPNFIHVIPTAFNSDRHGPISGFRLM